MARRSNALWRYVIVGIWLLFTASLATWWIIFSYRQIARLSAIESSGDLVRHQTMLLYEGATLLLCLLAGGIALLWLTNTAARKSRQITDFFAAFTHELKTPLASLRLQAELLSERLTQSENKVIVERLLSDTRRLNLQLENSLLLAHLEGRTDYFEKVDLAELFNVISISWPEIEIALRGTASVRADRRILEVIFSNIVRNAVVHGSAKRIDVEIKPHAGKQGQIEILLSDDGTGFEGNPELLGRELTRHYHGSGSGVGLFLCRRLTKQMGGRFEVRSGKPRFSVVVSLAAG